MSSVSLQASSTSCAPPHTPTIIDDWPIMYRNTLLLVLGGLSDAQIGDQMWISTSAIQCRLNTWIYPKLGVSGRSHEKRARSRAFLVALAGGVIPVPQFPLKPNIANIHLTETEREVLTFLGQGRLKEEIANLRRVGVRAIDEHVRHIYKKYSIYNQIQLMHVAHILGYVSWDSGKPVPVTDP